jgi:hypothetical protein
MLLDLTGKNGHRLGIECRRKNLGQGVVKMG